MSVKNSAGVKLNNDTELIIQAAPDGTVESVFNKSNNTEYVGGSSDFTTCTMTVSCDGVDVQVYVPWTRTYGGISAATVQENISWGESFDFSVILWKGNAVAVFMPNATTNPPTISGAIQQMGDRIYLVTGDCSITFTAEG